MEGLINLELFLEGFRASPSADDAAADAAREMMPSAAVGELLLLAKRHKPVAVLKSISSSWQQPARDYGFEMGAFNFPRGDDHAQLWKKSSVATSTRACVICGTTETPKWRHGGTTCNACGLR